jgi:hypothetical protein
LYADEVAAIGFTARPTALSFPTVRMTTHRPSRAAICRAFILPPAFPYRVPSLQFPPTALGRQGCLPGFLPSSRHHRGASTCGNPASTSPAAFAHLTVSCALGRFRGRSAEFPNSLLRSAHRFSRPLDGFLHTSTCGFVSPRYHVQGCFPFRGFSFRAATLPRRQELPPSRSGARRFPSEDRSHDGLPRVRGLAPRGVAFLAAQ